MANRMLRLFARRRQCDLRSIAATAGAAQGRRCALHDQVRRACPPADAVALGARWLFSLRRRARARAPKCAKGGRYLGGRSACAGARSRRHRQHVVARIAENIGSKQIGDVAQRFSAERRATLRFVSTGASEVSTCRRGNHRRRNHEGADAPGRGGACSRSIPRGAGSSFCIAADPRDDLGPAPFARAVQRTGPLDER